MSVVVVAVGDRESRVYRVTQRRVAPQVRALWLYEAPCLLALRLRNPRLAPPRYGAPCHPDLGLQYFRELALVQFHPAGQCHPELSQEDQWMHLLLHEDRCLRRSL